MRTILHSDLNNCFASIESISHPEYKKIPFAVGGDEEQRHGIILAKNDIAKKYGVKTGESLMSARQKCPNLKVVKPHFDLYYNYCTAVRKIYTEYTDQVEPFGIDESWLDTSGSVSLFGDGSSIADELRKRVKKEFGLTVSVGVSYNKVFAKLGSDYKKPDATTVITPENYKSIVWPLPAEDLLFVGKSTKERLNRFGIRTIGDIAKTSETFLHTILGKGGNNLFVYANGLDESPVKKINELTAIKSIGNSTTTPRDMKNEEDVNIIFNLLSEQVCKRLRSHNLKCGVVQISVRTADLETFERQTTIRFPTDISGVVCREAMKLFHENWNFIKPVRSVGIRASNLVSGNEPEQLLFFTDEAKIKKLHDIEIVKDKINGRYGNNAICRAVLLRDSTLRPNYNPLESKTSSFKSH